MKAKPHGNGSGKLDILLTDKGGWLLVYPSRQNDLPEDLPIHLSRALEEWFQERPHLRIRSAMSVVQEGNTVVIHAFYEQILWPQNLPARDRPKPARGESIFAASHGCRRTMAALMARVARNTTAMSESIASASVRGLEDLAHGRGPDVRSGKRRRVATASWQRVIITFLCSGLLR